MSDECVNYDDYNITGLEDSLENTVLEEASDLGYVIVDEEETEE